VLFGLTTTKLNKLYYYYYYYYYYRTKIDVHSQISTFKELMLNAILFDYYTHVQLYNFTLQYKDTINISAKNN